MCARYVVVLFCSVFPHILYVRKSLSTAVHRSNVEICFLKMKHTCSIILLFLKVKDIYNWFSVYHLVHWLFTSLLTILFVTWLQIYVVDSYSSISLSFANIFGHKVELKFEVYHGCICTVGSYRIFTPEFRFMESSFQFPYSLTNKYVCMYINVHGNSYSLTNKTSMYVCI